MTVYYMDLKMLAKLYFIYNGHLGEDFRFEVIVFEPYWSSSGLQHRLGNS